MTADVPGEARPRLRVGIDLGGTKIEIIAMDGQGRQLVRHRVATPRNDYEATLGVIAALVRHAEHEIGKDFTPGSRIALRSSSPNGGWTNTGKK